MKIVVFGATGFVGKILVPALEAKGHAVIKADIRRDADWRQKLEGADGVVNLAGASLFGKRWSAEYKALIRSSRVEGTQKIVQAMGDIRSRTGKPSVFVSTSAVGIYGPHDDEKLDENSPVGADFLAKVCADWEAAATIAQTKYGIRTVITRYGVVLGKNGGALEQMLPPFKLFVGGPIGSGRQWFPWVHMDDVVGIVIHSLENADVKGALNVTAPHPVTNKEFSNAVGRVLHRPSFMPVPGFALYAIVGGAAEIIVTGQRVLPRLTQSSGYVFKYPEVEPALQNICGR